MKKFLVEISEEAHTALLRIQADRKINKQPRATLKEVASDVLEEALTGKKAYQKETPSN